MSGLTRDRRQPNPYNPRDHNLPETNGDREIRIDSHHAPLMPIAADEKVKTAHIVGILNNNGGVRWRMRI